MDDKVRMGKGAVECFVIDGEYNGKKVELLLVPLFNRGHGWVGPGRWRTKLWRSGGSEVMGRGNGSGNGFGVFRVKPITT